MVRASRFSLAATRLVCLNDCAFHAPLCSIFRQPFMAPELLVEDIDQVRYASQVDIWAVGVVTHELLTTRSPFE